MKIPNSRCRSKLILRILLFLQFVGGYLSYLNVYAYFPMTKIEVFPQQVHSTGNVGNTAARTQSQGQEGCSCSAIEVLLRKLPSLSETRVDEELSVDLLRYIGEMLFELFSILYSVIIIIKILFITHTCTTAYNIHIYVFYVQHYVEYANYICIKGFVLPYFVLNIHIYMCT